MDTVEFLNPRYKNFEYLGLDLSRKMIEEARSMYPNQRFEESDGKNEKFDYVLASGIFNVKQDKSEDIWYRYIIKTIKMHSMVKRVSHLTALPNILTKKRKENICTIATRVNFSTIAKPNSHATSRCCMTMICMSLQFW